MNERRQLTLEIIAARIEWLRLLAPQFNGLNRRGMIEKYGFALFRGTEHVDLGCRLKFANIYGSPPDTDGERMMFNRDIEHLARAGELIVQYVDRLDLAGRYQFEIPMPAVRTNVLFRAPWPGL